MKAWLLIVCTTIALSAAGQWQLVKEQPLKLGVNIWADATGNAYLLQGNELILLNRNDSIFRRYSDYRYGPITHVDVSNSMKIMVYHGQQGVLVFLDNTLSAFGPAIFLQELQLQQVPVVCTSYENGFWVFEPETMSIIRFDRQLQPVITLPNTHILAGLPEIKPIQMVEASNRLYILVQGYGIVVFDVFGAFIQKLFIPEALSLQVVDQQLVVFTGTSFVLLNQQLERAYMLEIPENLQQPCMAYGVQKVWALNASQLFIWKHR